MPRERFPPDDPREWLRRARSNLRHAKAESPGVDLEDLCFDSQQAAEKALKGVLVARGVAFPFVHDLARLLSLLEQAGEVIPPSFEDADWLTTFAGRIRYPSDDEPVTAPEYERAVAVAETVVAWAEARIGKGRDDPDG